jgi:hypothetical protein
MNLAWGGIVLLVLLLPGFLFFVGLYFPERFTRQLAERSPLGQLAGTVLVAFTVHGLVYALAQGRCTTACVRLDHLLVLMSVVQPSLEAVGEVTHWLSVNRWSIVGYVLATGTIGLLGGVLTGWLVVNGNLRFLAQHTWVYSLLLKEPEGKGAGTQEWTTAYILTTIRQEDRIVLYRGYLKAFGIKSDGTFSYLVLAQPVRLYMTLSADKPATSPKDQWHTISTSGFGGLASPLPAGMAYLHVDGSQIANAMFDRETVPKPPTTQEYTAIEKKAEEELAEPDTPEVADIQDG